MARSISMSKKVSVAKASGSSTTGKEIPTQQRDPDAIAVLTQDHRIVEELFREFDSAQGLQLQPLAERICKLLRVHTQIEEELLYPVGKRTIAEKDLVDDARAEHDAAKMLIAKIERMSADDAAFRVTVQELAAAIKGHVEKEESELFTQMRVARLDLQQIGRALAERRATLLEVLGLHEDDQRPALPYSNSSYVDAVLKSGRPH